MHGRVKVKTLAELTEEKRKVRDEKVKLYRNGTEKLFENRKNGQFNDDALTLCSQLLGSNPDFSTLWNYRRELIMNMKNKLIHNKKIEESKNNDNANDIVNEETGDDRNITEKDGSDEFQKFCDRELQFIANCIVKNCKSYCSWHHREWIITVMPKPDFNKEIDLCKQFLDSDERNFHCWDYRRFICKLANITVHDELQFTLEKIRQSFSNFSSWYYRSCLFTLSANNGQIDFAKHWADEYDLVQNALFTDPSDQSPWFYHKWLMTTNYGKCIKYGDDRSQSAVRIERLVFDTINSKIILSLSRPIKYAPLITIIFNGSFVSANEWRQSNDWISSIWYSHLDPSSFAIKDDNSLSISPCPTFAPNPECIDPIDVSFINQIQVTVYVWEMQSKDNGQTRVSLSDEYIESLKCLHEMEPHNKWVNLSLLWLNSDIKSQIKVFDSLISIDPLRLNYYNDQKSCLLLKEAIDHSKTVTALSLHNQSLSALYYGDRLTHLQFLDLSFNNLKRITRSFNSLVCLEVLIVDSNHIHTIERGFKLEKLKVLSLNNNALKISKYLQNLNNCIQLMTVAISENPLSESILNDRTLTELTKRVEIITDKEMVKSFLNNYKDTHSYSKIIYQMY